MMTSENRKDVDGGWAWVVLIASFMNLLLASGIGFVSGIFQKLFLEQFGESVAFTAWVTALFSSFMQLAGPLSGLLTSLSNCRMTVMVGGVLLAAGLAASSFATSLTFLFVTFGLIAGVGLGLMYTPSIVIVNFFFDRRRTVVMGLALSASGIGITGSPILSRFLIDEFNWRETMMILAAIAAHVCIFGAVMFPTHEPSSPCLRLYRRCRGLPPPSPPAPPPQQQQMIHDTEFNIDTDPGDHLNPAPRRDLGPDTQHGVVDDQSSLGSHGHAVVEMTTPSSKPRSGSEYGVVTEHGIDAKTDHLVDVDEKVKDDIHEEVKDDVDEEVKDDVDASAERPLLLEKTNEKRTSDGDSHIGKLVHSKPGESPVHLEAHPVSPHHHHFGSGKSLNKIAHHLNLTRTLLDLEVSTGRHISHSADNLHRLHRGHAVHHPVKDSLRGVLKADGGGTPRGSRMDTRAISIYSSIQSLHSVGLPSSVKLVALSSESTTAAQVVGDVENGDKGGGGGGSGNHWVIFKNPAFLFLCVNLFLSNMACGIFNIHLPAFSQQRGLDDHDITMVLAMDGLAVFVSRILVGALGHDDRVDKLAVYFGLHLIASFVQAGLPFSKDLWGVTVFTILMGTYYGSVYSLLTSLTISIVGLPALAFAFGVEMICAGLGYLVAPPLAGVIVDATANYDNSMYLGGLTMFTSALALLCLTCGRDPSAPSIGYHPPPTTDAEVQNPEDQQQTTENHTV